jgi:hypothetical protein
LSNQAFLEHSGKLMLWQIHAVDRVLLSHKNAAASQFISVTAIRWLIHPLLLDVENSGCSTIFGEEMAKEVLGDSPPGLGLSLRLQGHLVAVNE